MSEVIANAAESRFERMEDGLFSLADCRREGGVRVLPHVWYPTPPCADTARPGG